MRHILLLLTLLLGIVALATACTDDETPFNEIDRLRVLGIAADPPWLLEGQTTELTFLSVNGDPTIDDSDLRTRWYFCPLQADSTVGFECFIQAQEQLEALTGTVALPPALQNAVFSEFGVLVGTSSVVNLPFIIPADVIAQVCEQLDDVELPIFVTRPSCNGRFPVTMFLEYGVQAQGGIDPNAIDPDERVVAFRDIDLVYDTTLEPNPPNRNPEISGLSVAVDGSEAFIVTSTGAPITLKYDTTYDFRIDVASDQSESFQSDDDDVPDRESLTVTWFVESGDTEFIRTGFLPADDGDSFADLIDNEWTTPRPVDVGDRTEATLSLVIRDGRGGLSWITRDVVFDDETGL